MRRYMNDGVGSRVLREPSAEEFVRMDGPICRRNAQDTEELVKVFAFPVTSGDVREPRRFDDENRFHEREYR